MYNPLTICTKVSLESSKIVNSKVGNIDLCVQFAPKLVWKAQKLSTRKYRSVCADRKRLNGAVLKLKKKRIGVRMNYVEYDPKA